MLGKEYKRVPLFLSHHLYLLYSDPLGPIYVGIVAFLAKNLGTMFFRALLAVVALFQAC